MIHRIPITACPLLLLVCCSSVLFSQISGDSDKEFNQAFHEDLQITEGEMIQFGESLQPLFQDMQIRVQARAQAEVPKMMANMSPPPASLEQGMQMGMRLGMEIAMEEMVGMQKPINDKAAEFFSEAGRQKMHLRLFQMKEGLMDRLGTTDNQETIQAAFGMDMMQLMGGHPDFLDLSPEQRDLILKQQKDSSAEALTIVTQASMKKLFANPGKLGEIQRLAQELQKAETDEERVEITKKLQDFNKDMFKEIAPELKAILVKGHEDFHRVLTDAQKAKVKAIMVDMPDYMKKKFAEMDEDGGTISGLDSWVPGMGVPGMPNPNREAPRQRTGSGGRVFPGN